MKLPVELLAQATAAYPRRADDMAALRQRNAAESALQLDGPAHFARRRAMISANARDSADHGARALHRHQRPAAQQLPAVGPSARARGRPHPLPGPDDAPRRLRHRLHGDAGTDDHQPSRLPGGHGRRVRRLRRRRGDRIRLRIRRARPAPGTGGPRPRPRDLPAHPRRARPGAGGGAPPRRPRPPPADGPGLPGAGRRVGQGPRGRLRHHRRSTPTAARSRWRCATTRSSTTAWPTS